MSAINTFRRTMRRLERRAKRQGTYLAAYLLHVRDNGQQSGQEEAIRECADNRRFFVAERAPLRDRNRRAAFLYERAADAVVRLTRGQAEEAADALPALHRFAVKFVEVGTKLGKVAKAGTVEMRALAEQFNRLEPRS